MIPYDAIPDAVITELLRQYSATAKKLSDLILHPPGILTQEYNRARAQIQLAQVKDEIARLKHRAADWTGAAAGKAITTGKQDANQQILSALKDAGLPAPEINDLRLTVAAPSVDPGITMWERQASKMSLPKLRHRLENLQKFRSSVPTNAEIVQRQIVEAEISRRSGSIPAPALPKPVMLSTPMDVQTSWAHVDRGAIRILASQTVRDLNLAASGMEKLSATALAKIEALKVSPRDVSDILGGRIIIEGKPAQGVRELRDLLQAVHGAKTLIPCKDGIDREYDTKYYAELVARTRTRDIVRQSRHDQFQAMDCDLVKIVGTISKYPCTRLVGHIYSLSGKDAKYPALSTVAEGQEPYKLWHPHCGKRTQVYIASAVDMRDRIRARIESQNAAAGIVAERSVAA